jgi:hypothetical protein
MDIRTGRSIRHLHFRDAEVGHREVVQKTIGWQSTEGKRAKRTKGWPLSEHETGKHDTGTQEGGEDRT